jgi:hypothetical protein
MQRFNWDGMEIGETRSFAWTFRSAAATSFANYAKVRLPGLGMLHPKRSVDTEAGATVQNRLGNPCCSEEGTERGYHSRSGQPGHTEAA